MSGIATPEANIWRRLGLYSPWLDRALLLVFIYLVRLPGFAHSVVADWDEALYALMARELLHGGLPYVTIFLEKPLGSTILMSASFLIFGENLGSVRLLGFICVAATGLLLREIALWGGLSRLAGAVAAMLYAIGSIELGGMASNIELMLAPFTAGAVLLALRGRERREWRGQIRVIAGIGLLIGIGIWCKYISAFPGSVIFALLVGSWLRSGWLNIPRATALAGLYLAVCLLPTIATGGAYAAIGQWDAFWYCNFGFMPRYAAMSRDAMQIELTFLLVLLSLYWQLLFAFVGLVTWRDRPVFIGLLLAWLGAETIALVVPLKFYDHYFLLLIPPLALLGAQGVDGFVTRSLPISWRVGLGRVPVAVLLLLVVAGAGHAFATTRARFGQPDPSAAIAAIVRADPGATVWVTNHQPIIYFLAKAPLPSIYAFPPHLTGTAAVLARIDPEQEVRRLLSSRPRYLVYDPAEEKEIVPELRRMIQAAIVRDYTLLASFPGKQVDVLLYRLR